MADNAETMELVEVPATESAATEVASSPELEIDMSPALSVEEQQAAFATEQVSIEAEAGDQTAAAVKSEIDQKKAAGPKKHPSAPPKGTHQDPRNAPRPQHVQHQRPFGGSARNPNPTFAPQKPIENGINVKFQISADFDTQLFDFRQMESFSSKLSDLFGVDQLRNTERNSFAVFPTNDKNVDRMKNEIIECYVDEALGVFATDDRKELAEKVTFSEVIIADIDTFRIAGKGAVHWGVLGLSDVGMPRAEDDHRKYRSGDSYKHLHQTLSGEKLANPRPRHGMHSTEPAATPKAQMWLPIINVGVVLTYRLVTVVEKSEGVFVPQYEVAKTYIARQPDGTFKINALAPRLEPSTLMEIVFDQVKRGVFRTNTYLDQDLITITEQDLDIKVQNRPRTFANNSNGPRRY